MEREKVLLTAEQIDRQMEFCRKVNDLLGAKEHRLAMVQTYGCQQNVADGERIRGMLREMGFAFTDEAARADVIVINTCAIREHAEQRIYGLLGSLTHAKKARGGEQIICLCGCMAQQQRVAERVRGSYRHVDLVFGPQAMWKFPELLYRVYQRRGRVFSIEQEHGTIAEGLPIVREGGVKAWVSVMYGCNNFCSYCIVPYVRGRERSRDAEEILRECRELIDSGVREITLLGQNVNSYGKDLPQGMDFADLLAAINDIPGDYLIRFMTSHPKDASHKLLETMARCDHVAKQLHLPVQSGNDRVLGEMNRRYTREGYLELVRYARALMPEISLTSDIIIGFPGETESEAMDTVSLVEEVRYDALFTFLYSPRPGTPAAKMPDPFSRAEKQVWFDRLVETQNRISAEKHAAFIGKSLRVLVDGTEEDARWNLSSRTEGGRLVHLAGSEELIGRYCRVKIVDSNTWAMFGEVEEVLG